MESGVIALLLMIGRLAFYFFGEKTRKDKKIEEAKNDLQKAVKEKNIPAEIDALDRLNNLGARVR